MYNSNATLSNFYETDSQIVVGMLKAFPAMANESFLLVSNFCDYDYFSSIELTRNKIKNDLADIFTFENNYEELDYLSANIEVLDILPRVAKFIKKELDEDAKLSLELMREDKDWVTLFINIRTRSNWDKVNAFTDKFLEGLFDYKNIADKLNINVIPDEI